MKRGHDELAIRQSKGRHATREYERGCQNGNYSLQRSHGHTVLERDVRSHPAMFSQLQDTPSNSTYLGLPGYVVSRLLFLRAHFNDDEENEKNEEPTPVDHENAEEHRMDKVSGDQRWGAIYRGFETAQRIKKCVNDLCGKSFDSAESPFSFSVPPGCSQMCSLNDALQRASALEILRLKEENGEDCSTTGPANLSKPRSMLDWLDREKQAGHEDENMKACFENVSQGGCLAGLLWAAGGEGGVWLNSHDRDQQVIFGVVCYCAY